MACVSAMQKAIRRGLEREAMEFAVELMHTSQAFHSMVCNRLEVICHEDLDTLAAPHRRAVRRGRAGAVSRALHQDHRRSPPDGRQLQSGSCAGRPSPALAATSLRPSGCGRCLKDFAPDDTGLRPRHAHDEGQGDGPWPRSFPPRGCEAGPAADRAGSLRGRSLPAVGDQAAGQVTARAGLDVRPFMGDNEMSGGWKPEVATVGSKRRE